MNVTLAPWVRLGEVRLAPDGRLALATPPSAPGIYRFLLTGPDPSVYVGETDQLPRRFAQYRNPGPSQSTNIRLNDRMRAHLRFGGRVSIEVATTAWVEVGAGREQLDLTRKSHRLLAEEAALEEARAAGLGTVENIAG